MAVTTPAMEARELYRFYHVGDDETQALRGVSMEVRTIVSVVGPSRSAKWISGLVRRRYGLPDSCPLYSPS